MYTHRKAEAISKFNHSECSLYKNVYLFISTRSSNEESFKEKRRFILTQGFQGLTYSYLVLLLFRLPVQKIARPCRPPRSHLQSQQHDSNRTCCIFRQFQQPKAASYHADFVRSLKIQLVLKRLILKQLRESPLFWIKP